MKDTTLIFDYDGTIHNTMKIYEPAFRKTYQWLVEQGVVEDTCITNEQIASWLGWNSRDMWNAFQPNLAQEYKEQASAQIGNLMIEQIEAHQAEWYPKARQVLETLKSQYHMVVLSNCKIAYRQAHWKEFQMEQWFDSFYDCESYHFIPKTEIVKDIMSVYPSKYIVIGDRKNDMECAKACGGMFIGCLYGFSQPGELDASDKCIRDITELLEYLQ